MKFLPIATLESINSVLCQQPSPSCLVTIRTDAFSCRKSKDDKKTALAIRENSGNTAGGLLGGATATTSSAHGDANNGGGGEGGMTMMMMMEGDEHQQQQQQQQQYNSDGSFGDSTQELFLQQQHQANAGLKVSPFDHLMGAQPQFPNQAEAGATAGANGNNGNGASSATATASTLGGSDVFDDGSSAHASNPEDILVFLVSTLNAIHGQEYDFSVLGFESFDPIPINSPDSAVISDVNGFLTQLQNGPVTPDAYWRCINEALRGLLFMGECQAFLLNSPSCDPLVQRFIFPKHYFIYCRKLKMMLSIQCYGEGNAYRGDDGMDDEDDGQYNMDDGEEGDYWGKNRGFYGFGGDSY